MAGALRGKRRDELMTGRGYRRLPSGSYQVRIAGFSPEVFPDELAAALRVAELRLARRDGRALPGPPGARFMTLGEVGDEFLRHKLAHGGRHGELTPAGVAHWKAATRPWREGGLSARPLRAITLRELQEVVDQRTSAHRVSARNEAQALLAILRFGQRAEVVFPPSLLLVQPPKKTPRTRRDLTLAEFDYLVSFVDPRQQRLFEIAATLGSRINELFMLERDWISLEQRRISFPLEVTKERRTKVLDLTDEEVDVLRAQLEDVDRRLGRRTRYVFPKPLGSRWRYGHFHEDVWSPARRDAAAAWRREHGCDQGDPAASTPFDSITLHSLRRTCVGWLRASALPVEVIAQRLGHADGGATLLRHYRYVREGEVRAALDSLGRGVRAHLRQQESRRT